MFEDRGGGSKRDDADGDAVASSLSGVENIEKRKQTYLRGDLVKVIEGDLKNLKGHLPRRPVPPQPRDAWRRLLTPGCH